MEISPRQTLQTNYWYESSLLRAKVCGPNKALGIGTFEKREDKTINIMFCNITGVHTLGRARRQASGYNGPWVRGGQNDLDNRFYIEMRDRNWVQVCRLSIKMT